MHAPPSSAHRRTARGALTLHVDPNGSDTANGLSPDNAFATIQAAVNSLMWEWDLRGSRATISVADGVYKGRVEVRGVPVGSTARPAIIIEGNIAHPSNCLLDVDNGHAFQNWGGHVEIAGFKFVTKKGACIFGHSAGHTTIGAVEFGHSGNEHILAATGHQVRHKSDYAISGDAAIHAHVVDGAVYGNGRTVTLMNTPHFRDEFHGLNFAKSLWTGTRFVGAATGLCHLVHFNSVCAIGGADAAGFFPGDRLGIVGAFSTMG